MGVESDRKRKGDYLKRCWEVHLSRNGNEVLEDFTAGAHVCRAHAWHDSFPSEEGLLEWLKTTEFCLQMNSYSGVQRKSRL